MEKETTLWYMIDGEQYITVYQVAALRQCAPITIYRAIWGGKLAARKIGGTYYVAKADFEAYVKAPAWPVKQSEPQAIEA